MNNADFITREAALTVENTEHLYGTVLSINATDANAIKRLTEEVIVTIEDNSGEKFLNFNEAVRLAIPTVAIAVYGMQEEAKS